MTISALPPAPSRSSPSDFSTKADDFIAALQTFVDEANALAVAMNLNDTTATSTTSLTIGTGSKSLTVDLAKSFQPGMSVKIAFTTSPSNWMHGDVTSYNAGSGALVVNVTNILGSGTETAWTVTLSGPSVSLPYASAAEINTGTEAIKVIAPDQLRAAGIYKDVNRMLNVGIAATVAAKALTVALKGEDGNDPSATNPIVIAFRDETLTTGTPNIRTVTAETHCHLSSGSTLGFTAALAGRIYVWAIDNAGTVELALSRTADIFPESNLVSSTAEGGAGAADSASVMYSTTARTDVACRCIGYIEITTGGTAGEWDNAPTKIQIMGQGVKRFDSIVSGIPVASTSGNSIDFTSIPAWVKRITEMFQGVSTNGTSKPIIQLGDAGGFETSGYSGSAAYIDASSGQDATLFSSGFSLCGLNAGGVATFIYNGTVILTLVNSATFLWSAIGVLGLESAATAMYMGGTKALTDTLTQVRITTANGTDAFDAGLINIMYE